jgi:hypothetical protein
MHAEDDRYTKFFLFTEEEVALLNDAHKEHHVCPHELKIQGVFRYLPVIFSSWMLLSCEHTTTDIPQEADPDLSTCSILSP